MQEKLQKLLFKLNEVKEKVIFALLIVVLGVKVWFVYDIVNPDNNTPPPPRPIRNSGDPEPPPPEPKNNNRVTREEMFRYFDERDPFNRNPSGPRGEGREDKVWAALKVPKVQKVRDSFRVQVDIEGKRQWVEAGKVLGDYRIDRVVELKDNGYKVEVYSSELKERKTYDVN